MEFIVTKKTSPVRRREKWSWKLVAGNGRTICTPHEKFVNKQDCLNNLELVQLTDKNTTIRMP